MPNVYPTPAARADLLAIREFSLGVFSPDVADGYFLGFDEAFDLLETHPFAGPAEPDYGAGMRCLNHRSHRIFYTIVDETILIVRVLHHAQDARRHLHP